MASEVKQLLVQIEGEHLACRRGYNGLIPMTRAEYDEKRAKINEYRGRLLELIGESATNRVEETLNAANLLFERELALRQQQQLHTQEKEHHHASPKR